jgi:predicted nucleotidyltransferase
MPHLQKNDVIAFLRDSKERFATRYGVRRIGLFGSVARDRASQASDLDVVVEMESPTFDRYMDLKFELEDRFGVQVDLVLSDTVKDRLRPVIERETVYA